MQLIDEEDRLIEILKNAVASLPEGTNRVEVSYNGSGDEGNFEMLQAKDSAGNPIELHKSLESQIVEIFEEILSDRNDGWEINEGSYGYFEIDVVARSLIHNHTEYVEQDETRRDSL